VTTSNPDGTSDVPIVGIVGAGVTGSAVARVVAAGGARLAWFDTDRAAADRAVHRFGGVMVDEPEHLSVTDVIVLAHPVPHAPLAATFLGDGRDVVAMSDEVDDTRTLLDLEDLADYHGARLVVGASLAPGLSGLLARHLASRLDVIDEIHVATHGTGGPACARQHHDALGTTSLGWHDEQWVERPGGSGRELCWFPEPIGAVDCYRAGLADPLVLREAFPGVQRISARVSATRRDRMTARLPMLTPPHRSGDLGAVRVEVRGGMADGARITHIAGAAGRAGELAGTVAALWALAAADGRLGPGRHVAGADPALAEDLLGRARRAGVSLHEFTGVPRLLTW
jgi:hypothetical protein